MEQEKNNIKIVKMKDIIRLFFKFDIDYIPIIDKDKKLKGLVDKKLIIQDAADTVFIEKPFSKLVNKFIFYPSEESFLQIVSAIPDELKFPVIDIKGSLQYLWFKKDILNSFYNISKKSKSKTEKSDLDYKDIIDAFPLNLILVDEKNKIVNANKNFLHELDFEQDIILNQNINKFFTNIHLPNEKNVFYPKIHSLKYRHIHWYYTVLQANQYYIFLFSLTSNPFNSNKEIHFSEESENSKKSGQKSISPPSLTRVMESNEKNIIKKILEENEWNITQAAQVLKIPRQTLQYKISKYKIA